MEKSRQELSEEILSSVDDESLYSLKLYSIDFLNIFLSSLDSEGIKVEDPLIEYDPDIHKMSFSWKFIEKYIALYISETNIHFVEVWEEDERYKVSSKDLPNIEACVEQFRWLKNK